MPYVLTEEFVSVYRMHPLMRNTVDVYDVGSGVVANSIPIEDTRDGDAENILDAEGGDRLWYSFGITNPGSLTLNNYPEFLRNLSMPLIGDIDLAAIDIIRDHGAANLTTAKVAKAAGMTRGAIQYHFENPKDLLREVIVEVVFQRSPFFQLSIL